jgi:hypothetical protein
MMYLYSSTVVRKSESIWSRSLALSSKLTRYAALLVEMFIRVGTCMGHLQPMKGTGLTSTPLFENSVAAKSLLLNSADYLTCKHF